MKTLQVFLMLFLLNVCLAQDITLKKLYDGIEDMRLEVNAQGSKEATRNEPYAAETANLKKLIGKRVNHYCGYNDDSLLKNPNQIYIEIEKAFYGSFTEPNLKQILYRVYLCELGSGVVITENSQVISAYAFNEPDFDSFSVKDINQNGLNEIMVIFQSQAKRFWSEMHAMQLLEFPKNTPVNLGSFFIGGYPSTWTDGPRENFITCSPKAPKEYRENFPSNIIYVQKSKNPLFFAEGWEVNCDYLSKGVKARKVSSLAPIKPVKRDVPLTRIF